MKNIYQPELMDVASVQRHTADVKSVKVRFRDADCAQQFQFRVGQFGIFSAFGYGESVFNICSSSTWNDGLEFCFRKTGRVTEALWEVEEGDTIGFRGPYGNGYPVEGEESHLPRRWNRDATHPLRHLVRPREPR